MVTIRQIAERAGVSRATVDKVIHNRPGVSENVRAQIQEILKELDFEPNVIGTALAAQSKAHIIGVILLEENTFFAKVREGVEDAAKESRMYGIEFDCRTLPEIDVEVQLQMIQQLRERGMSGLAIVPIEDERIRDAIDELCREGIPVVVFNSDIPMSHRKCFIGQNHLRGGQTAGELMGKMLDNQGQTGILAGSRKVRAQRERVEGFCQVIGQEYPGISIVDIRESISDEEAYQHTLELFKMYPELRGIYLTSGTILGVEKALNFLGKKKQVKIVTFDATKEKIRMIEEGMVDFTIDQKPYEQGYQSVRTLTNWLVFHKEPQDTFVEIPIDIKTKYNVDRHYTRRSAQE